MKFKDYLYERPNYEKIKEEFAMVCEIITQANDIEEVYNAIDEINCIRSSFASMSALCSIRNSIDTTDKFYEREMEFFDEYGPIVSELENNYAYALINCRFVEELKKRYGSLLFDLIKVQLETFSPEIIPELQEEGKLVTQYSKLVASFRIEFDGKTLNLSQMTPYLISPNRQTRKEAETALWKVFEDNVDELDTIYDNLVKVRHSMALKLGFKNYIELGYKRLGRTEYTDKDVKTYRDQVLEDLVPLATKIFALKAKQIGVDKLMSYDMGLNFLSGNPKPIGDLDYKVKQAQKMYHEMSEETKEFVDFMLEHENIDLMAKQGKQGGGYCTYIPNYSSPFVFANFNGTSADIDVLTHEFGHAFQVYSSRNFEVLEYFFPTLEACEIHSMSMEFFAWPWMELFFGDDTPKYKYSHLSSSITFIPYGVLVDEFQHEVYENPTLTTEQRKMLWRRLEKKYMPYKVYDNEFLERGNYWIRQSHIYSTAFYYIDYTLAQNCAHQFWVKNNQDHEKAWSDYLRLCQAGGSKSFLELLKLANLENPFNPGTLKKVTEPLKKWLDEFDFSTIKN